MNSPPIRSHILSALENEREKKKSQLKIGSEKGHSIKSIAFPRNQTNGDYLEICKILDLFKIKSTAIGQCSIKYFGI